ncbi:N-lysine methyltransferase SMYD2-B-like [Paramacrobiotus metropolitanus]|uniref:N-lysine methyltransferase SMYD2-B-like n=1 Tax=Paramacrobiotus metropolitanus TaxID=2943436 RepID=UPI00244651F7|nr:N-lysine methyltransferase SMYD2-B-like [Paramacrobiotus metropolitanus]
MQWIICRCSLLRVFSNTFDLSAQRFGGGRNKHTVCNIGELGNYTVELGSRPVFSCRRFDKYYLAPINSPVEPMETGSNTSHNEECANALHPTGTGSFKAGDEILSCEPWIWCLDWRYYPEACAYCLAEPGVLQMCSKCRVHRYCSKECQGADWRSEHKNECKTLKHIAADIAANKAGDLEADSIRSAENGKIPGSISFILTQKIARKARLNAKEEIAGHGKLSVSEILDLFPRTNRHDYCVTITYCNAIPIYNPGQKTRVIGMGLFPQVPHWTMTPVCLDSNITMDFQKRRLFIHAMEDIPVYRGMQDLRYAEFPCDLFSRTRLERREMFEKTHRRPCICRKCTKEYAAEIDPLKCVTPGCMERLPSDERSLAACPQCGALNDDRLKRFQEFSARYEALQKMCYEERKPAKEDLRRDLDDADILHRDAHFRYVLFWTQDHKLHQTDHEQAWKIFEPLIPFVRAMYPKYIIHRAQNLLWAAICVTLIGRQAVVIGRRGAAGTNRSLRRTFSESHEMASGMVQEAVDIFLKLCGADSPKTKEAKGVASEITLIKQLLKI